MARNKNYTGDGLAFAKAVSDNAFTVTDVMEKLNISRGTVYNYYGSDLLDAEVKAEIAQKFGTTVDQIFGTKSKKLNEGAIIRRNKAIGDGSEDAGLIYVPIAAQAGYTRNFEDPVFVNQLDRLYIPGLPYRGDRYRYFDVEGDSMEPTLEEGMQVIGENVYQEEWKNISDFYIYVIVKLNRILIKRLFKKDDRTFVMISDNEQHPQEPILLADIKELWLVKRKLDWRMTPPKRFEILV